MGIDNISSQIYTPTGVGAGGTTGTSGTTSTTATGTELSIQAILAGLQGLPDSGQGNTSVDGLPPPDGTSSTSGALGSLSDDEVSADIYSFMALFQKMAQSMRDTARMERSSELQTQVTALQNAADQMKTTAGLRFAAGVVQGAMQIAGGLMQIGMSSASMSNTIKGAKLDAAGNNDLAKTQTGGLSRSERMELKTSGNDQIAAGKIATAEGGAQLAYGQALSGVAGGVGGIVSSGLNYAADMSDAEKAKFDVQAKVAETASQHASDMMQQMMDVIRDVRDKLQSIQQAAIETNRGIARNI